MTDLLSLGASGTRAYGRALATVSSNISNASNADYVRRDLRLNELAITGGIDPYHNYQISFGGVEIGGVARASDPFLEANVRLTGSARVGAETRARWSQATENALNDNQNGIGKQLNQLFSRGEELAAAPFEPVLRAQFIADIDSALTAFNQTANRVSNVSGFITETARQDVADFNNALENLAEINKKLRTAKDGSGQQANLLDSRDTQLAILTEKLDVTVSFAEKGVANISYDGVDLVEIGAVSLLELDINGDGTLGLLNAGNSLTSPSQGSLSALVSSAATNAQRLGDLNNLATQFAGDLNGWQVNGVTDNNAAGSPLLDATGGAAALTLLSRDPASLALGSSGGPANSNILALSGLRGATGTEQAWTNIIGSQAIIAASAQSENAAASAQHEAAREARDNLSAVDLDREAADLIRFQQAYDASARVIQVARETMQSILAIF